MDLWLLLPRPNACDMTLCGAPLRSSQRIPSNLSRSSSRGLPGLLHGLTHDTADLAPAWVQVGLNTPDGPAVREFTSGTPRLFDRYTLEDMELTRIVQREYTGQPEIGRGKQSSEVRLGPFEAADRDQHRSDRESSASMTPVNVVQ
jgi:hypothetical protein